MRKHKKCQFYFNLVISNEVEMNSNFLAMTYLRNYAEHRSFCGMIIGVELENLMFS